MQKLTLVQPYQLTWHSLSSTMWILSVFSPGEVRGKNKNHFYQYLLFQICPKNSPVSNTWHHCTSPAAIFASHFLLAILCCCRALGNIAGNICSSPSAAFGLYPHTSPKDLPLEILKVSPSVMKQETNRVSNIKGRPLFQSTIISSLERSY